MSSVKYIKHNKGKFNFVRWCYNMYQNQKRRSKTRGHKPPTYSKEELREWVLVQKDCGKLFLNYINSGLKWDLAPSIDRLDDYKGYSFDNIRICTNRDNYMQAHYNIRNGINNKKNKPILQFDLDGNFIKEHYSQASAARSLGNISYQANINRSASKGRTAYNFKWQYKKYESN